PALRGPRQTAVSLSLDGALLVSATVNSNLGVILSSDYLKLTDSLAGTGTLAVSLSETSEDGSSPVNGPAPSSVVLIESGGNTADLAVSVTGADADAIFGWDVTRDGDNWLLGQKRFVPVVPAVAGINAALQIAAQSSFGLVQDRLASLRLLNNGRPRPGNDWFVAAAYRHDTVTAPLYRDAEATTRVLAAGVNLTPSAASARRKKSTLAYGIYTDFTETQLRLPDAETHTKTNALAASFAWQPNAAFHVETILRGAKTSHAVQVEGVDEFRIGATGAGAAVSLGYTLQTRSGWFVDLRERLSAHITSVEKQVTDSAHRVYDIADLTSIRAGAGVQFSRRILLRGKWAFRPSLRLDYDHEIKGGGATAILRYYDDERTRLRDRHEVTDDLSGGALTAGAGAAINFNPRLEAAANLSATLTGPLQDYALNLAFAWRW
ncbi:autotransporter outer membrane beta-barrel domain-containing protein, partial [Termitidicoccus mucosus]|uniref:autotransporter outer membrane beta-barrel domain-containing protein n=1 Tax=Termitidicoccus mucosus TaxID=1184151 RepID=UPI002FEE2F8A